MNEQPAYDCIVLGTGGIGSAALYHMARRGARVPGVDPIGFLTVGRYLDA